VPARKVKGVSAGRNKRTEKLGREETPSMGKNFSCGEGRLQDEGKHHRRGAVEEESIPKVIKVYEEK